jgi:2-phosphosulfolactate phosphatase
VSRGPASRTVAVDFLAESAARYRDDHAIVAIDVIRATTTLVTAVSLGFRCFPVPSLEHAVPLAAKLDRPLLVGELGGNTPYGFDLTNSPAQLTQLSDIARPIVLLSSSGTSLIHEASRAAATYVACLRNYRAVAAHVAATHERVAVIGAGTRGEFREEDQLCCAWVARELLALGFETADIRTAEVVERWRREPADAIVQSKSVTYLRDSGQVADLDFILAHVDDVDAVHVVSDGEVVRVSP